MRDIPIDDLGRLLNEINTVERDYKKSHRNDQAIVHDKFSKHMMHLIRLYMMGIDIMGGKIITYRNGADHDLLMDIRHGKYLEADKKTPTPAFTEILDEYQKQFDEAVKTSRLPEKPDMDKLSKLYRKVISFRDYEEEYEDKMEDLEDERI